LARATRRVRNFLVAQKKDDIRQNAVATKSRMVHRYRRERKGGCVPRKVITDRFRQKRERAEKSGKEKRVGKKSDRPIRNGWNRSCAHTRQGKKR